MARITVEDCLNEEGNRFALVRLASHRAKQLLSGSVPVTNTRGNRAIVAALREIAAGKVKFKKNESALESDHIDSTLSSLGIGESSETLTAENSETTDEE